MKNIQEEVDRDAYMERWNTEIVQKKGRKADKKAYLTFYFELHDFVVHQGDQNDQLEELPQDEELL